MKLLNINHITKTLIAVIFLSGSGNVMAQENQDADFADRIHFWRRIRIEFLAPDIPILLLLQVPFMISTNIFLRDWGCREAM
jgi:hypothetical protein